MLRSTCNTVIYALDLKGEAILKDFIERCRPRFGTPLYGGFTVLIRENTQLRSPPSEYRFVRICAEGEEPSAALYAFSDALKDYKSDQINLGGLRLIALGETTRENIGNFRDGLAYINSLIHYSENNSPDREKIELLSKLAEHLKSSDEHFIDAVLISVSHSERIAFTEWSDYIKGTNAKREDCQFSHYLLSNIHGEYALKEQELIQETALFLTLLCFEIGGYRHIAKENLSAQRQLIDQFFYQDRQKNELHRVILKGLTDGVELAFYQGHLQKAKETVDLLLTYEPKDYTSNIISENVMLNALTSWLKPYQKQRDYKNNEESKNIDFKEYYEKKSQIETKIEHIQTIIAEGSQLSPGLLKCPAEDIYDEYWSHKVLQLSNELVKDLKGLSDEFSIIVINNLKRQFKEKISPLKPLKHMGKEDSLHATSQYIGGLKYISILQELRREFTRELSRIHDHELKTISNLSRSTNQEKTKQEISKEKETHTYEQLDYQSCQDLKDAHSMFLKLSGNQKRNLYKNSIPIALVSLMICMVISALCENFESPPIPKNSKFEYNYYVLVFGFWFFKSFSFLSASFLTIFSFKLAHHEGQRKIEEQQLNLQSQLGVLREAINQVISRSLPAHEALQGFEERCHQYVLTQARIYKRDLDHYFKRVEETNRCLRYLERRLGNEVSPQHEQGARETWSLSSILTPQSVENSRVERFIFPPKIIKKSANDLPEEYAKNVNEDTQDETLSRSPWENLNFSIDHIIEARIYFLWVETFVKSVAEEDYIIKQPEEQDPLFVEELQDFFRQISLGREDQRSFIFYGAKVKDKLKVLAEDFYDNFTADSSTESMLSEQLIQVVTYPIGTPNSLITQPTSREAP